MSTCQRFLALAALVGLWTGCQSYPESGGTQAVDPDLINIPTTCPVTRPPETRFVPPVPYPEYPPPPDWFWYGDNALWTALPGDSQWSDLPHNPEGYTQKILWWREGYVWTAEPEPALTVSGRRLDGEAEPFSLFPATNAFAEDIQSAMLMGVDFPTLGCWEVTGQYGEATLSFVIWIAP